MLRYTFSNEHQLEGVLENLEYKFCENPTFTEAVKEFRSTFRAKGDATPIAPFFTEKEKMMAGIKEEKKPNKSKSSFLEACRQFSINNSMDPVVRKNDDDPDNFTIDGQPASGLKLNIR